MHTAGRGIPQKLVLAGGFTDLVVCLPHRYTGLVVSFLPCILDLVGFPQVHTAGSVLCVQGDDEEVSTREEPSASMAEKPKEKVSTRRVWRVAL